MVNTKKFSEFAQADINDSSTQNVGLSSGINTRELKFYTWTTATRPATPFNGLLGLNTDIQEYEWWNSITSTWVHSITSDIFPILASHLLGQGASLIGLQDQSNVSNKTVQDLANAPFIAKTDNGSLQNAQFLGSLTTGIVKNTTVTGVLSISAPLTSIDSLTTVANNLIYTIAPNTYDVITPAANSLLVTNGSNVPAWSQTIPLAAQSTITMLGTITSGVWHGSPVEVTWGGTGNTSFPAYTVICAGVLPTGDLQHVSGVGSSGQVLTSNGAGVLPTWQTPLSGSVNPGLINEVAWYAAAGSTVSGLTTGNNGVLITSAGGVPSIGSTLPSAVQANITRLGVQSLALDMGNHQIHNVTDPSAAQDAATRAYVDSQFGNFLPLGGGTMSGAINMGNNQINALANPTAAQDAVTLSYMNTQLALKLSLSGGTMTGNININSHLLTNLVDPTNPQDAATKNYVDTVAIGLTVQAACYAGTTANLTATYANGASGIGATLINSGALAAFSVDGISPPTNSRILVKNQSSTFQNGIYVLTNVGSGAVAWILTRATDYDQPSEIQPGDLVIINNGTTNGGASFIQTDSVSVIGTDPIEFSQFTFSATSVLLKANNLSDVANTTTSFNNISPLTTKGDLIAYSSQNIRLAVGATNGQILQVSSGAATGLAWSTASYPVTTTVNEILYSSATNTVTGLATLAGGILVTDGSGVPSMLTNPGATGKILQSVSGASPAWSVPIYPSASGSSGKILISDGTNVVYSTPTYPNSAGSTGHIIISNGTNFILSTPAYPNTSASAGKILISDGTNFIASTPTYPNVSATIRKMLVSDGTNFVASTETWAVPGSSGNVLTSDGTNWTSAAPVGTGTVSAGLINQLAWYAAAGTTVSGLATAASSVLVTSAGSVPSLSTTLPSGLTIPGYATSGANSNITSMTGLTGVLQAPTAIASSAGLAALTFTYTASAVNYINIRNGTTGNGAAISSVGSDSNVDLLLSTKGNGNFGFYNNTFTNPLLVLLSVASNVNWLSVSSSIATNPLLLTANGSDSNIAIQLNSKGTKGIDLKGYADASSASAGYTGEYLSAITTSAAPVALVNVTGKTVATISLTAGRWIVYGELSITGGATTAVTSVTAGLSATTNSISTPPNQSESYAKTLTTSGTTWVLGTVGAPYIALPPCYVSVSTTTPYYLVAFVAFTISTCSGFGKIWAVRI